MFLLKRQPISERLSVQRLRLVTGLPVWICMVSMIPFGLAMILIGKLIPAVDPRLGSPAQVIELKANGQDGYIRISISMEGNELIAIDGNRKRIVRWPASARRLSEAAPLVALLRTNAHEAILTSSLSNQSHPFQTRVIIAMDQHLSFYHLKPVLYALAEAKITNYAFETAQPSAGPAETKAHASRIQVKPLEVLGRR